MPVNRVATATMHQQSLKDIASVQISLAKLNRQISSGVKASNFTELNGIIERVSSYETKLSGIDTYLSNNLSVEIRLNTMDQSVTKVQKLAADFSSLITQRNGDPTSANSLNFRVQAENLLSAVAQELNISVEGRYLFSGSKTDTKPVPSPVRNNVTTGEADDHYYDGNSEILTARISDSVEIEYGITGNEQSFQDLIAALKTAIAGDRTTGSESNDLLAQSVTLTNLAITGLATTRAKIGSQISNLNDVNDQHETLKVYWRQAVSEDTATDIAEASIQLAADQTVLQATFQAFASLSRLKLTDFLN